MKPGLSSLNPNAASYVPLFKREVAEVNQEPNSAQEWNSGHVIASFGHQPDNTLPQSYAHSVGAKCHQGGEPFASTSQYPNQIPEKSNHEYFDMDMAFLQMTFPDVSEDSLSGVYEASCYDLDAAVDMLQQLEHTEDSSDRLPDTLDIGDVAEVGVSSSSSSNVASSS